MFLRTKRRKAISAVLTTLIILVASVVLGTGVVLYGTSLFQTGAQGTGLTTQGVHVWVNSTSTPTYVWGAAAIRNSGDKILSVDTITVRGTNIPYTSWFSDFDQNRVSVANFQSQLNYTGTDPAAGNKGMMLSYIGTATDTGATCPATTKFHINEFGAGANPTLCLSPGSGPISLKPGDRAIVYFQVPNGVLSTVDSGASSSVAVYAGNVGSPQSVTVQSK